MTVINDEVGPVVLPEAKPASLRQKIEWHVNALIRPAGRSRWAMPYPTVDLSYWAPTGNGAVNFGDELSRTIVNLMLARRGATLFDNAPAHRQMLAVGSVLHMARDNAVIWGTGLHGAMSFREHHYSALDVRAVRGPITRRFLRDRGHDVPEIYGDPALLLPMLTQGRFAPTSEFEVGLVPNLHDTKFVKASGMLQQFPHMRLIDPLRSWEVVVADILRHKRILASSLHGLVVAETFGIPAVYVRLTEHEPLLKYQDYYGGTGRNLTYETSLNDGLDAVAPTFAGFNPSPLVDAFPYDIWGLPA